MNISRLKPILSNGVAPVLKGAFSSFTFPFGQTVIFTMVFSNISKVKNHKKNIYSRLIHRWRAYTFNNIKKSISIR
ncbi:GerAB/ArcD/ProY family transporter [Clostridium estertheticum]|uniref:GerAB/ArcD/ProY family transporter n=1 Tax=Clostridium estertheticum TaxID=238834 RepID=UPI0021F41A14|nr:GerAB/ArcD/ProY family transporter [Clostridium estertheticum]